MKYFKPSDQLNDPEGWLGTQIGHAALGVYFCISYLWLVLQITGNYPSQTVVAIIIPLTYLFIWEIGVQGFRLRDSTEDTLFVAYGSSLLTTVDISQVIDKAFLWCNMLIIALLLGFYMRTRRDTGSARRED